MTPEQVIDLGRGALEMTIVVVLVVLLPALAVGLTVSMFQAATQINEMTLSFIPKLIITLFVLMVAGPWILDVISTYTQNLIMGIPEFIGVV